MPGYSTKYFVPYLCCYSQRDKFQGWLGKKGLLVVRPGVIHPTWALPWHRVSFRQGKMGLVGIMREDTPHVFATRKASKAPAAPMMDG